MMNSRTLIVALSLLSSAAFANGKGEICHDGKGVQVPKITKQADCKTPNVWGKQEAGKVVKKSDKVEAVAPTSAPVEAPKK